MRSYEGQLSDAQPTRRNRDQKQRQLAELREALANLKPHVTAALRASVTDKIAGLEAELGLSATVHIRTPISAQPAAQSRPMMVRAIAARPVAVRATPVRPATHHATAHHAPQAQTVMGAAFDTARQRRLAEANAIFAKLG